MTKLELDDAAIAQLASQLTHGDTYEDVIERHVPRGDLSEEQIETLASKGVDVDAYQRVSEEDQEQLAESALLVEDIRRLSTTHAQLSAAEYVRDMYDLDPSEYQSEQEFLAAMKEKREEFDGRAPAVDKTDSAVSDSGGNSEQLTPSEEQRANELAREVMGAKDVMQASEEQLSPREYARNHLGVDPAEFASKAGFIKAVDQRGSTA